MTFPTTTGSTAQAQFDEHSININQGLLSQSRETGEVFPKSEIDVVSIAKQGAPVAKPWAHFVAGG